MLTYRVTSPLQQGVIPSVRSIEFNLSLNAEIFNQIDNIRQFVTEESVRQLGDSILTELIANNWTNTGRLSSSQCSQILDKLRDDPCLQTITDKISLETFFNCEILLSVQRFNTKLEFQLSLHA